MCDFALSLPGTSPTDLLIPTSEPHMFQWKRPATIFCLFGPVHFKDELILAVTHLKKERTKEK